MNNKQIKQKIIDSCLKAREMGRKITHSFGNANSPHCCALTAAELIEFGPEGMNTGENARKLFGWDHEKIWAFISGFDYCKGGAFAYKSHEAQRFPAIFEMGKEVAEIVKPVN